MNHGRREKMDRKICWRVTRRCNLHCSHCLAGHKNFLRRDLKSTELLQAAHNIVAAGITRVTWSGGEPTLCKSLPDLITVCHTAEIASVLTTHGLTLSLRIVSGLDPALDAIRFSFDGLEPAHDVLRGGKYFGRTVRKLIEVIDLGYIAEANISITAANVREIPQLVYFLGELGVRKIVLLSLMARESAVDNMVRAPSESELITLRTSLQNLDSELRGINVVMNDYTTETDYYIVVESDGDILICSEANEDKILGNILSEDGVTVMETALMQQTLSHRKDILTPRSSELTATASLL